LGDRASPWFLKKILNISKSRDSHKGELCSDP